jgi:hypothetical protein
VATWGLLTRQPRACSRIPGVCVQVCGYDVPAGTWFIMPGCAIDRSIAVYGEDADEFRPDRWLSRFSDTGGKDGAGIAWAGTGAYDGDDAGGVTDKASAASVQSELWLQA